MSLKDTLRAYAYELGADLVGFGDIGRCQHAPPMMSPQGLMPTAQTILVMAIHHPDACIELGGERHPQDIGPYSVQYLMNTRLDEMAYRMATFIEREGYGALPIASSNIWRYNQYKQLKAVFAPDVSHIYMAVVAGLADMGFNGLALSPEYGARNRFITVITDAEIEPDPLIPPNTVCDGCMLCRKHCPAEALSKEIDGENVLKIGPYEYRFPRKNLWRCAWGEHFDLDLDLEIPEKVTEQVILDNVQKHGIRSGEMGQCLKFCVPKTQRTFDKTYSRTPMRKYEPPREDRVENRSETDRLLTKLTTQGVDEVMVSSAEQLREIGIDLERILPGARSAVTPIIHRPAAGDDGYFRFGAQYQLDSLCYDLTRSLEEQGYRSVMTRFPSSTPPDAAKDFNPTGSILQSKPSLAESAFAANTVITRKVIAPQHRGGLERRRDIDAGNAQANLTGHLSEYARSLGADLVGVASASRIDEMVAQLRPVLEADRLDMKDRSHRFKPCDPEITVSHRTLKTPGDWLEGAKSVLVLGLRYHKSVLRWAAKPPAEAVGPYSFQTYETHWLGAVLGYRLIKRLEQFGYKGVITLDLTNSDSVTASPREALPDLFTNRFAALAAGLGTLTVSGHLATPQFGLRQRCLAIVTDAPLEASSLLAEAELACETCDQPCVSTCPSQAITSQPVTLNCEGHQWTFHKIDPLRCDWSKRYALTGDSGNKFIGSPADVAPPEVITPELLSDALKQLDPIKKYRPVIAEPCVINCPLAAGEVYRQRQ